MTDWQRCAFERLIKRCGTLVAIELLATAYDLNLRACSDPAYQPFGNHEGIAELADAT